MKTTLRLGSALALLAMSGTVALAGPEKVAGPGADPECFAPWDKETKYLQWPAKEGPFRIALVNGYVGNAWRIQMVKTAKAFAKDPAIAPLIKEFKVVSTGTDIAGAAGRDRGLHQPGVRRDRDPGGQPRRLRSRDPAAPTRRASSSSRSTTCWTPTR